MLFSKLKKLGFFFFDNLEELTHLLIPNGEPIEDFSVNLLRGMLKETKEEIKAEYKARSVLKSFNQGKIFLKSTLGG